VKIGAETGESSSLSLDALRVIQEAASAPGQGKTAAGQSEIFSQKDALPALLSALGGIGILSAVKSIAFLAAADILLAAAACSLLRLNAIRLLRFLGQALPFILAILLPLPFFIPGAPLAHFPTPWGILSCSQEGLQQAFLTALRFFGAAVIVSALNSHFHWRDITRALTRLGIPPAVTAIIQFTMRYAALIGEELQRMLRAQRNRGFSPGRNLWHLPTLKALGSALGYLFIRTFNRAERIYLCMAARGYLWELAEPAAAKTGPERRQLASASAISPHSPGAPSPFAFQIRELSYAYPGSDPALRNITLDLPRGRKIAILGANGAGKSTLLLHLNATLLPQSGEIWLDGELLTAQNEFRAKQKVGMVFQDPDDQVFCSTIGEDIAFGPQNLRLPPAEITRRVENALVQAGLAGLEHRAPHQLSCGQKKRAAIAGILAMDPPILVLDEPTASLDPRGEEEIMEILENLNRQGRTVIIATHDIDLAASWADMAVIIKEGQILAAGSTEILFRPELMRSAGLRPPRLPAPARQKKNGEGRSNPTPVC